MVDRHAFDLSIVLLTEDGAQHAHETLEAVASRMLLLIEAKCRRNRVAFARPSQFARDAMQGNQWRSRNPKGIGLRDRIVLFGRFVAEKLLEGHIRPDVEAPGFVFFHFDGDHAWQDRHLTKDEKVADLEEFLRRQVIPAIDGALHKQRAAGIDVDVDAGRKAALLRLRRLTPFYSIEAWLFQNTAEARRLCSIACGKHAGELQEWEADRGKLDELDKPKDELPCIETQHHVALASSAFPASDVYAVGKSYAAAVDNLRRCRDLRAALARTTRA
jgi:hypothetical protein